jgi:dUTP pyrophosphatase
MIEVKIKRISGNDDIELPKYETPGAAAVDLRAAVNEEMVLEPGETKLVPTGFAMEVPFGFVAHVTPRSGLAIKKSITVTNTPGTIDSDYRGEVKIILMNQGREPFKILRGDRIAQMNFKRIEQAKFIETDELSETSRGEGGFGSTGQK